MSDSILEAAARAREAGPDAINATIGVLYDENGDQWILPTVREAMNRVDEDEMQEDGPVLGNAEYRHAVEQLLGNHRRTASIATSGGEEALSMNLHLVSQMQSHSTVALATPMWEKHANLCHQAGLSVVHVPHVENGKSSINGMRLAIKSGVQNVLLQATSRNPDGFDYTQDQWYELASLMKMHGTTAIVDMAYQGCADEPEQDAICIEALARQKVPTLVAWSGSKNHAMPKKGTIPYERIGLAAGIMPYAKQRDMVERRYKILGNERTAPPSAYAQHIIALVQRELHKEWRLDLKKVRRQLDETRTLIANLLPDELGSAFRGGKGLFALPKFTPAEVEQLRIRHNIHLPDSGRVNIGGIPLQHAPTFAEAVIDVKEK